MEETKMKQAIIGLAALVAGCATAAHEMPTFETTVRANAEPAAAQVPAYSSETPLPSETFSYDTAFRGESEEIVTMDTHGYTIQCGNMFFMHTENKPQHDVLYRPVVNGGCEDMIIVNNESGSQRWLDTGCEGLIDSYEEFDAENQPFARESPVGEGNTSLYGAHFELLLLKKLMQYGEADGMSQTEGK
jgi:hypothetical protein